MYYQPGFLWGQFLVENFCEPCADPAYVCCSVAEGDIFGLSVSVQAEKSESNCVHRFLKFCGSERGRKHFVDAPKGISVLLNRVLCGVENVPQCCSLAASVEVGGRPKCRSIFDVASMRQYGGSMRFCNE
eukprot:IDg4273t1